MQINSAESLLNALRDSKLFAPEEFQALARELAPLGSDPQALMRYLVLNRRMTKYQLGKVVGGKAADLILGPYVIVDKIGEGGMGKVYRARQKQLDRDVALKVVRPSLLSNPVVRKRWEREVRTTSEMGHPNIVAVYDAGEYGGRYFLAMEFVDGVDLSKLIRTHGVLPWQEACEYVRQAALGLHHAHQQGFVHRDIKPSNIVVGGERHVPQAKGPAFVKILDLGLVRAIGLDEGGTELTRDGTVVGTPDYMAPEQAKNSSTVDHRADLYSLGCALFFLLTGRPPFPEGSPIEKLLKHQLDPPPSLPAFRPDVPPELAQLVYRLMAKRPEQRTDTALELAEILVPMARYPGGSKPVSLKNRIAVNPGTTTDTGETPHAGPVTSETPPGREGGATPAGGKTSGRSVPLSARVPDASPFEFQFDPPSSPMQVVTPRSTSKLRTTPKAPPSRAPLIAAIVLAAAAVIGITIWFVVKSRPTHPAPDTTQNPAPITAPDTGPKPARPGIVPPNTARLDPLPALIPDGAGLVVVTYPTAYFGSKDSPYYRGATATKLRRLVDRFAADTEFNTVLSDRVVISLPHSVPGQAVAVSEGGYVTAAFATRLDQNPKIVKPPAERRPQVFEIPRSGEPLYSGRVGTQGYAVATDRGLLDGLMARRVPGTKPPADLDPGVLPALTPAGDPPLLVMAAGGRAVLPFGDRKPLKDAGVELLVGTVRVGERAELELAVTGEGEAVVGLFLLQLARHLRTDVDGGGTLADLLERADRVGEAAGARYRVTLRTPWPADAYLAWLAKLLE